MSKPGLHSIRARLLHRGAASIADADLLGVALGSASLARALHQSAERWFELTGAELQSASRITSVRAAQMLAIVELGRRIHCQPLPRGKQLQCSDAVAQAYGLRFRHLRQEVFMALALDARNRVIAEHEVARGSLASVEVHPREAYRLLIKAAAAGAVFVHNHPSGDPTPSEDDRLIAQRLTRAGELLGVPVLDFVIVGDGAHVSFADRGWL